MSSILLNMGMPVFIAAAVTIGLVLLLNPIAKRIGWVDKPDNLRKLHESAIPLTGGVAMLLAYVATVFFLEIHLTYSSTSFLMMALVALCLIGILDDIVCLSAGIRLLLQASIALFLVLSTGISLNHLGDLFGLGHIALPLWAANVFAVFCIVGVINAVNMIDGMDGLAAGLSLICLVGIAFMSDARLFSETLVAVTLIGCLSGYLFFNMRGPFRKRASIFMGDAGSMVLGAAIAWALISLSQPSAAHSSILPPVLALWLLAIPLLDTVCLMIRRKLQGKSPFTADRDHLHHTLKDAGLTDCQTTVCILLMAILLAGTGITLWSLTHNEAILFYSFLALALAYYRYVHQHRVLAASFGKIFKRKPADSASS